MSSIKQTWLTMLALCAVALVTPLRGDNSTQQPLCGDNSTQQPLRGDNSTQQPVRGDNSTQQPLRGDNSTQQPLRGDNSTQQPLRGDNSTQQPLRGDNSTQQSLRGDNSTQQPLGGDNSTQQPVRGDNSTQQPVRGDNSTQQPVRGDNSTQQPVRGDNSTQQPVRGDNSTQQPVRGDNSTQQPVRGDNSTQQPVRGDNSTQQPVRGDNSTQQPVRGDNSTQQPLRGDNSTQQPLRVDNSTQQPLRVDNSTQQPWGQTEVVYEWLSVDYDWPSDDVKQQFEQDGRYVPSHNLVSGVKTHKGEVYLTVPRLRYPRGVPSTLNRVVQRGDKSVLRPFPDWGWQELGNCSALQCVMSMEVDPISGHMYVIDVGRSGFFGNVTDQPTAAGCPAKLVVFDLADGQLVRSHDFPEHLVSKETNFLNDIVLDRGSASSTQVKWVHVTDAIDARLVTFSLETNLTHVVHHASMNSDPGVGSDITVNGRTYKLQTPIDGLAISADFQYIYYCALGSKDLYQVPSDVVRYQGQDFAYNVRLVGSKISQTGGLTYGTNNLYYGALTRNGVYRWEVSVDERDQGVGAADVLLKTEVELVSDDEKLQWPDSFTVDEQGYLWFTACRAQLFLLGAMDFDGAQGANFRVWRVNISEKGYLAPPGSSL